MATSREDSPSHNPPPRFSVKIHSLHHYLPTDALVIRIALACSILTTWLLCVAWIVGGQSLADDTIALSSDTTVDSARARLQTDVVAAITQGASPAETTGLVKRQRQMDAALSGELDQIRERLAAIEQSKFDRELETEREALRRRQSLLWLARVELASLAAEMFADGSTDAIALAGQAVQLIREALASFPGQGEVRGELVRLLSDAHLRSGDPDAAIRTLSQTTLHIGDVGEPTNQEVVINTADELAFVIRVDLSKRRWQAAADKLRKFYGGTPSSAPQSTTMDLVRLQYLIANPTESSDLNEVGQWLDAIERRGGKQARRNAETILSRSRRHDTLTISINTDNQPPAQRMTDPRVLRADARYLLRVGEALLAAITFARAAADDSDAGRSIQSAVQSAAILQELSKQSAAAELLQQIANRHQQHELAPTLMLQAAALAGNQTGDSGTATKILNRLLGNWPVSEAARSARITLIETFAAGGKLIDAAALATQMPAEHWNEASAKNCRELWQRAIVPQASMVSPCHWDDDDCQYQEEAELVVRLDRMRSEFAAAANHPLAMQTQYACTILLDSFPSNSPSGDPLKIAAREVTDLFLNEIAGRRLGIGHQSNLPELSGQPDTAMKRAVVWRLHHDVVGNPATRRSIAKYLLTLTASQAEIEPQVQVAWLIWSGQTESGVRRMRLALQTSARPADLIATAASALAGSSVARDLRQAAGLWQELADGLPSEQKSHQLAHVESIVCQWRSGDRIGANAAAELMLLTNPPQDSALRNRLQDLAQ